MVDHKKKDYHPLYVPFYLLYQFSLIILLNSVLMNFKYPTETVGGLTLLYSIVFYFWKPYELNIHNYANSFNQAVVLIFLTISVLAKHNLLTDTIKIVCLYVTITLIVISLVLQMAPVYVYKKSLKRGFHMEKKEQKKKPEDLKLILQNNPYIFRS